MKNYRMKYFLLSMVLFAKIMIAQPIPLSEKNKATYASISDLLHMVPFDDGKVKGYIMCNISRATYWMIDSLNWSNEMLIAYNRALILELDTLNSLDLIQGTNHWFLPKEQIKRFPLRWSDKKLLKKWDRLISVEVKNETLWLSYILALWKRGFMVRISSETGDLLLIDPQFPPYKDYPEN